MLTFLSCSNRHVNSNFGYEITGPSGWSKSSSLASGKNSVIFRKKGKESKSSIKLLIERPLYKTPLASAENHLSILISRFPSQQRESIRVVQRPRIIRKKDRVWATYRVQITKPRVSIRIYYITLTKAHTFKLFLTTSVLDKDDDEKAFLQTVDSFKILN